MSALDFYFTIILIYMGTDLIAAWGLNLEFGVTGVPNLAYIVFFACGAYTYAVLTVGPASKFGGSATYLIGANIDPALAILAAIGASAVLGVLVGLTGLRRLRLDYQALAFLIISFVAIGLVGADDRLFNGLDGMSLIPNPLGSKSGSAAWWYVGLVALACVVCFLVARQLTNGPMGRALRAVRDDEDAALAVGKNVTWMRLMTQAVGAGMAGLSGALLVGFIGGWAPSAWAYTETLALITAIIVGGRGSNKGVTIGTILVLGGFLQGVQYLPTIPGRPGTPEDIGWIVVGALTITFLFLRPEGVFPERRPRLGRPQVASGGEAAGTGAPADATVPASPAGLASRSSAPSPTADAAIVARRLPPPGGQIGAGPPDEPILAVKGLVKSFGGVRAVDEASFHVPYGSVVGLIGPNGAGKSTALGIVSGFIRPDHGVVEFAGRDVTSLASYRRARIGLVRTFQLSREFTKLTLVENLLVAALNQRGEHLLPAVIGKRAFRADEEAHRERARELIDLFQLHNVADSLAGTLSGGQKRLLEMMRALMLDPRLLLLDEPMAGLSPAISERLEHACRTLRTAGVSVILVEHELGAVERLCDNVIMMAQGRVLAEGAMADLRRSVDVQEAYFVG